MRDILIIIVGTNERQYIEQCLNSIYKNNTTYTYDIVVVDNASTDGTTEMIKKKYHNVRLMHVKKQMGYMYNNNRAIEQSRARYILTLNADTELGTDTLQILTNFMDIHTDAAVCACRLNYENGALQLTCRRFPTPWMYLHRLPYFLQWLRVNRPIKKSALVDHYLMNDYDHKTAREVPWLVNALFFMRKTAIEDIGMYDEKNFMQPFYFEDVDWAFRAHKKGWKVYYVPETISIHHYQRDSVKKFGWLSIVHIVNLAIFYRKHGWSMLKGDHKKWE